MTIGIRNLEWLTSTSGLWCSLTTLNLDSVDVTGVYVIWGMRTVYVGQGVVRDRLAQHLRDQRIMADPNLLVTCAAVWSQADRDGIERYLANVLDPAVGDGWPDVTPIPVNLPW